MEAEMPGRVLTFRQPDMAHLTGRAWIDHYDPRLAGLHGISASDAAAAISALGARFAYVPSQTPVTITRSALGLMLADPKLARPLAEHRGARLFALTPESSTARCEAIERFSISTVNRTQGMMDWLAGLLRLPQLARRSSQEVYSGPRALPIEMGAEGAGPAELRLVPTDQISGRFVASVTLAGSTIVELSVDFEDGSGNRRRQPLLNGLGPPLPSTLQAQAVTLPGERLAAIIVQRTPGHGEALVVQRATLCQVVE
jgi:hypothetical protein